MVAVRNSTDWNMISYSTLQALKHDCVGLVPCNSRPEVAPWGGTSPVYGMNPFSVAIPRPEGISPSSWIWLHPIPAALRPCAT